MAGKKQTQSNKSDTIKKKVLKALEKSKGIVTTACQSAKIARSTFYKWYEEDSIFASQVDDIKEVALDFVEGKLFNQIEAENITGIIFYLKTKGKKRGYVEKQQHEHNHNNPPPFHLIVEKTYEQDTDADEDQT